MEHYQQRRINITAHRAKYRDSRRHLYRARLAARMDRWTQRKYREKGIIK